MGSPQHVQYALEVTYSVFAQTDKQAHRQTRPKKITGHHSWLAGNFYNRCCLCVEQELPGGVGSITSLGCCMYYRHI